MPVRGGTNGKPGIAFGRIPRRWILLGGGVNQSLFPRALAFQPTAQGQIARAERMQTSQASGMLSMFKIVFFDPFQTSSDRFHVRQSRHRPFS
jgi:hypothetical protein